MLVLHLNDVWVATPAVVWVAGEQLRIVCIKDGRVSNMLMLLLLATLRQISLIEGLLS